MTGRFSKEYDMQNVRLNMFRHGKGARCTLLIGLLLLLVAATSATGRTISVPGNAPTIKGAMIKARAGDIILVACGTYRESNISVKPGVALWSGTLQPDCVTIDAGGKGRCLLFSGADSTTSIVGFTLSGGVARGPGVSGSGGAILCEDSSPRITGCILSNNTADRGGALAAFGLRGPRLENCRLTANEARNLGGAVHWAAETGSLQGCALVDNHAQSGGGAFSGHGGRVAVSDCLVQNNSAGNTGGGLSLVGTEATISRSVLAGNVGGLAGGALACRESSPVLRQCTLHANEADGDGTVLSLTRSDPTFEACLITGSGRLLVEATDSRPVMRQSNVFADGGQPWLGLLASQQQTSGNLAADPRYCEAAAGDFHLRAGSPCLAGNGSPRIGALGQGCGAQFPADVVD